MTSRLVPTSTSTSTSTTTRGSSPGPPAVAHANNFDALRLALALAVVVGHSFQLADGSYRREPTFRLTSGQLYLGNVAVCGFFLLSGYLITQSWERSTSARTFAARRLARIVPGYLVAVLVTLVVVAPLGGVAPRRVVAGIGSTQLPVFLRDGTWERPPAFRANPTPQALNGSLWTIPYEVRCYLGVALLGGAGLLRRRWVAALLGTVLLGELVAIHRPIPQVPVAAGWALGDPYAWFLAGSSFLAGMLAYLHRDRLRWHRRVALAAILALVVACRVPPALCVAVPTAGAYLFFLIALHPRLRLPGTSRFGDFSYGIYLYSFPIQQLIVARSGGISPVGLMAWSLPLSVGAGAASWFLVERRFLRRPGRPNPPSRTTPSRFRIKSCKDPV